MRNTEPCSSRPCRGSGLEDLEALYLLETMSGSADLGKSIVAGVVHTAYSFEHAPEAMLNARANISK